MSMIQRSGDNTKMRMQAKSKEKNFPNSFAFKQWKSNDNMQSRGSIQKERRTIIKKAKCNEKSNPRGKENWTTKEKKWLAEKTQ